MIISINKSEFATSLVSLGSLALALGIIGFTRTVRDIVIPGVFLGYQISRICLATLCTFVRDQRGTQPTHEDPLAGLADVLAEYQPTRYDRSEVMSFDTIEDDDEEPLMADGLVSHPIDLVERQEIVLAALKPAKKRAAKPKTVVKHDGLLIDVAELLVDSAYARE